ncbi:MAG: flagellin, partial [Rubrivivax sp.]
RVQRASDDPAAAARAERALATQLRAAADQRALDASRNVVAQAENALGDAGELFQQVREAMVGAGNPSYSDAERQGLAGVIRGLREQLLAIANRGDGADAYLFGGQGSDRPPFVDAPGGVAWRGSSGQSVNAQTEAMPLALDGRAVWLQAPNAVDGAPDQSSFALLDRLATELETRGRDPASIAASVADGLRDVDAGMNHLLSQRARLGETLNRSDSVELRLSEQALSAQAQRSAAEDLDLVQVVSEFQNRQTGYDAALKAYAMVQRMSLFNYLGS